MTNKQTKLYSGYRHRFRRLLLLWIAIIYSSLPNFAQESWNIQLSQSSLSCSANEVCYQVELQNATAGSWTLGDQNYRFFFDGDLMTVTSVTSLLPAAFYSSADIDQNVKFSGLGQDAASPLDDIDDNLGFLDFSIVQTDKGNPAAAQQIGGSFIPTAEICVDVAAAAINDPSGSNCLAFYHSRPATAGDITSQYTVFSENDAPGSTVATTEGNFNDLTSADGSAACLGSSCNACATAGGDSDNDGVCDNDDCEPNNPNRPTTPGTACNDGNAQTSNDVIQADGCTCAGTVTDPCANAGGDSDNDGICDNNDCEPNNPNLPTTPGTVCDDNNSNTINDVIQADGCTCRGSQMTAAEEWNIRLTQSDVNCASSQVCYQLELQSNAGSWALGDQNYRLFFDGDLMTVTSVTSLLPNTFYGNANVDQNTKVSGQGQEAVSPLNDIDNNLGFLDFSIVQIDRSNPNAATQISTAYTPVAEICVNVASSVLNDATGSSCLAFYHSRPATAGSFTSQYTTITENEPANQTMPTMGANYDDLTSVDGTDACIGPLCDSCANRGGDSDNDGVCDNDDCQPNNPNLPTTPGTACNDGNANTTNDVIQADGCTCQGMQMADEDEWNIRLTQSAVNCTSNQVCYQLELQSNAGSWALGDQNYRLFFDGDLMTVTSVTSLLPNTFYGNANIDQNTKVSGQGQEAASPLNDIDNNLGFLDFNIIQIDRSNPNATTQITSAFTPVAEICVNVAASVLDDATGSSCLAFYHSRPATAGSFTSQYTTITENESANQTIPTTGVNYDDLTSADGTDACPGALCDACVNAGGDSDNDGVCDNDDCQPNNPNLPTTPGTACNDGNANTVNDVILADGCTCAGTINDPCANAGGDSDNDGVCDNDDCEPNNPNLPTTPGTACNDGNSNTINDVIQADGCTCAGTPDAGDPCSQIMITGGAGQITVGGLNTPIAIVKVFDSRWQEVAGCSTNCSPTETYNLPTGTYYVTVKLFNSSWQELCDEKEYVEVTGGGCNDRDNDGVCDEDDCAPNNPTLPTTPGRTCNDGNPNTVNDVIQVDGCTCAGTVVNDPCANRGGDSDNDGVCDADDCAPNDPNLPAVAGTSCNDGNPNTINDVIKSDGCTCAGVPTGGGGDPDCSDIQLTAANGVLSISGLTAPIVLVKVFDSGWTTVYDCVDCPSQVAIPNLSGNYVVSVKFLSSTWSPICEISENVTVPGGSGGTCDNFTNGGKIGFGNNCQNSTMLNSCPAVAPSIRNCVSPSGGSGDIEYIWLVSTTSSNPPTSTIENITIDPHWELIPSATSASYNPGVVHETSYFLRCARRENCSQYTGESNIIAIICNSSGSNITVSCPNNITVTQNTPTGTMVSWNPPTATTSCNNGGVSISQTGGLANGAMFPVGITTISYEITDGCGSTQTCSFDINVLQNNNGGGTAPTGYCSVKGTSPWTQWISNVRIGSINKTSTKEGYADFTSSSTDAIRGQQLQVRLTPGYSYTQFNMVWRVWIDWNRDGDFMDAGEMAFAQSRRGTVSGTINVPANASLGATRMRVAAQKDVAPTACESFGPGEVEDYTVQISNNLTIGGINFLTTNSTTFDVNDFKLYPNPATQRVNVEIKSFLGESITIQLFNQLGQLVLEKQIEEVNEQTAPLSVALLERGIYFVQLQAKNKTPITKKLLLSE
ncbi:MAG: GEVED domain-containing protein [Saprospiraceae bacterium]